MRLRCAACGCYVSAEIYPEIDTILYWEEALVRVGDAEAPLAVQPCKRCLTEERMDAWRAFRRI